MRHFTFDPRDGVGLLVRCDCGSLVDIISRHANQCPTCCKEFDGKGQRLMDSFSHAQHLADLLDDEMDDEEVDALLIPGPYAPPAFGDHHVC